MSTIAINKLLTEVEQETARVLQICNACRYCEGFCAVFPAMTRRLAFLEADIHYLANLCHNCGACLHACQYAPPHEFAVNVPVAMSQVRLQTYADHAWPRALGTLYRKQGAVLSVALALGLALLLAMAVSVGAGAGAGAGGRAGGAADAAWRVLWRAQPGGNFYAIFPHNTLVLLFGSVFGFAMLAMLVSGWRFWRALPASRLDAQTASEAGQAVLTLKYLGGGNETPNAVGCHDANDQPTLWRKRFHHATFYGFMLCFAATTVATAYHYLLGWKAPYPLTSLPVLLGMLGGAGLLVGPAGLAWLKLRTHPLHADAKTQSLDWGLIALLFFTSFTGIALTLARETPALPLLLVVHLGFVLALFATMPYGKMVHGIYRGLALLRFSAEKREPSRLMLGSDA